MKRNVLIVDDHPLFREGLKSLIDRSSGYEVVGEAGDGTEAVRMVQQLRPDLVTLDVALPGMSGVEAAAEIAKAAPDARILMITMHPKFEYVADAFRAGARGYVVKDSTSSRLVEAMDTLSRGDYFLDGNISQEVVFKLLSGDEKETPVHDERYGRLSPREQQVMRMVAEGNTTPQIAQQLDLSPKTVENHRGNLMKKLGVHNKMELVRYAVRLGLIDPDLWRD